MAKSKGYSLCMFMFILLSSSLIGLVSSSPAMCDQQSNTFLHDLKLQCPLSVSSSLPIEMDGDTLEQALKFKPENVYTAVLFYASWCPFSSEMRYKYDALSTMFPEIEHVAVKHSLVMPSLFSRYGVHSVPELFIVNQTAKVRYRGRKDLQAVEDFYKSTTGLVPVEVIAGDTSSTLTSSSKSLQAWYHLPWNAMITKEPYLVLSILFLLSRAFLYFCPGILSRVAAAWIFYYRHLNLGIFGETRQLLVRGLNYIDFKRVSSKLKFCKARNLHRGARSARVWASSLASVSLGKTSSMRS
ncbi:hypothetical protein Droror1_Dr00016704 [Drosera rotundifolia]